MSDGAECAATKGVTVCSFARVALLQFHNHHAHEIDVLGNKSISKHENMFYHRIEQGDLGPKLFACTNKMHSNFQHLQYSCR